MKLIKLTSLQFYIYSCQRLLLTTLSAMADNKLNYGVIIIVGSIFVGFLNCTVRQL